LKLALRSAHVENTFITERPVAFIGDENARCAPAFLCGKERAMIKRRRFRPKPSLRDRLAAFAEKLRLRAPDAASSAERNRLIKRARQAEKVSAADEWVNSPGQQPPK
jgi:hypothetical protein